MKQEYGANQIQVLEGLEAVRLRPGMYIGSTGPRGLHHLVYEIVDNSIDEALQGYCDRIYVCINEDGSVTTKDDGRGIPVETHPKTGKSTLETVLTILHAGGKFGGGGYKVSGGLHGVGISVVNGLSEWLVAEVYRNGKIYRQSYKKGITDSELEIVGESDHTGTIIQFMPDATIFDDIVSLMRRYISDNHTVVFGDLRFDAFRSFVVADNLADYVFIFPRIHFFNQISSFIYI